MSDPALTESARRLSGFVSRHRWSLSLTCLSALCFEQLGRQIQARRIEGFDRAVMHWLARERGRLDTPMLLFTRLGSLKVLFSIATLSVAALLWFRRPRHASFLVSAGLGAMVLEELLKATFRRSRPGAVDLYLIKTPSSFSFPSGHALGSTGVILALLVLARVLGLRGARFALLVSVAALLVLGVAASRVYFGVHFPSDVLGGMLAGAGWIAAVTGYFFPRAIPGEHRAEGSV